VLILARIASLALALLIVVAVTVALLNFRQSGKAAYFILRKQNRARAWRWVLVAILAFAALVVTLILPAVLPKGGPPAVATPGVTEAPLPTLLTTTSAPELTPESPQAAPPSPTATLAPPATQAPTPLIATIASSVTPPPGASLEITAIASGLGPGAIPLDPGNTFEAGITTIYVFFDHTNMPIGTSWSVVLLINGGVMLNESYAWDMSENGQGRYRFFEARDGWPPGNYEVRFYLGDRLADSEFFTLLAGD
jgi:hypothetical protein